MKIRHIGLVSIDIKKSINFWTKFFNFKTFRISHESGEVIDRMFGYKNMKIKTVKLKDEAGYILELISIEKPMLRKKNTLTINNGITHFAITVKNLGDFYKNNKRNINFNCPPQLSKDGKVKVLYAKTPENCFVELVEEIK